MSDKRRSSSATEEPILSHKEKAINDQRKITANTNSAGTNPNPNPNPSAQPHPEEAKEGPDTYLDPKTGLTVFTAKYLLDRGYCCNSNCRHCPYKKED